MASMVPSFDDALMALLVREADRVGETVEVFIERAVSTRLVQQLANREDPSVDDLLEQLAAAQLIPSEAPEFYRSLVLRNPTRPRVPTETGSLGASPPEYYDRLVEVAAEALSAPIAAIVLIAETWARFSARSDFPRGSVRPARCPWSIRYPCT